MTDNQTPNAKRTLGYLLAIGVLVISCLLGLLVIERKQSALNAEIIENQSQQVELLTAVIASKDSTIDIQKREVEAMEQIAKLGIDALLRAEDRCLAAGL